MVQFLAFTHMSVFNNLGVNLISAIVNCLWYLIITELKMASWVGSIWNNFFLVLNSFTIISNKHERLGAFSKPWKASSSILTFECKDSRLEEPLIFLSGGGRETNNKIWTNKSDHRVGWKSDKFVLKDPCQSISSLTFCPLSPSSHWQRKSCLEGDRHSPEEENLRKLRNNWECWEKLRKLRKIEKVEKNWESWEKIEKGEEKLRKLRKRKSCLEGDRHNPEVST